MELTFETVKAAMREVLKEEMSWGICDIASKWSGGTLILRPHDTLMQSKEIPIDVFFKKIVSVREKLRVLEQKVNNNSSLITEDKIEMQQLITRVYGSLTTFNVLFRDERDKFIGVKGVGGEGE
jgi:hypothetical protein